VYPEFWKWRILWPGIEKKTFSDAKSGGGFNGSEGKQVGVKRQEYMESTLKGNLR